MGVLQAIKSDASVEEDRDIVGGGYTPVDSGLYQFKVKVAYIDESSGGALALNLTLALDNGRELREQIWFTNKQKQTFYLSKRDNKKYPLPGFTTVNQLCLLKLDKELGDCDTEEGVVMAWNSQLKKQSEKTVQMISELLGQEGDVLVMRKKVDKTSKVGDVYVPNGETREENEIVKFLHTDHRTVVEIKANATTAVHAKEWLEKWEGVIDDQAKGVDETGGAGASASSGGTSSNTSAAVAKPSGLFGK